MYGNSVSCQLNLVATLKADLKKIVDEPILDAYDTGTPEQIAELVSYFASKQARFITGRARPIIPRCCDAIIDRGSV
jgi:hypothetical protein